MEQYIVSARKYRPDSFGTLIGQDNIVRTLKNSIKRGQLAHAYLFCGPRGVGKTSAARIFAKMINCEHPGEDMEPCGCCESCRSFNEGRSYCIHEMDAASNNGVDAMKELMEQVQIPPQVGHYSVYIIDEVHMLTAAAFNAFLKTLEEPPAHAIFILATTEKHKILPTILSRCQTYDFNRISIADIVLNLRKIASAEGISADDGSLHLIARKADGAMRDALTIFDQTVAFCGADIRYEDVLHNLGVLDYENCFFLVDAFLRGDYAAALLRFDEILAKGFNALSFVTALTGHLRDLLVARSGGLDALLEYSDGMKQRYREQAASCSVKFLYEALTAAVQCESGYKTAVNPRLFIEFTLMRLSAIAGNFAQDGAPAPQRPAPVAEKPVAASAPVPQPAPVAEKPAAEPVAEPAKPRRRAAAGAGALSLSSLKKEEDEKALSTKAQGNLTGAIPSDEVVIAEWRSFQGLFASKPRLAQLIANSKVEIKMENDCKVLTFYAMNDAQRVWVQEQILRQLEAKMQTGLKTSRILLRVDVTPDTETGEKVYLPSEKAKIIIVANPEVKNLVTDLDLDIR